MKYSYSFTATAAVLLAALPGLVNAQAIINTPPSLVVCQPAAIQFSGGQAPYFISVIPGGQSSAAALEDLPTQNAAGSVTWLVDIPAGTEISFRIRDGTGQLNFSDRVTIQSSSDTSCIGGNSSLTTGPGSSAPSSSGSSSSSSASSASSSGPVITTGSTGTSSGPTSAAPTTTARTTGTTTTGTTSVAPTTSQPGAAGRLAVQYTGAALAAVAAALVVVA